LSRADHLTTRRTELAARKMVPVRVNLPANQMHPNSTPRSRSARHLILARNYFQTPDSAFTAGSIGQNFTKARSAQMLLEVLTWACLTATRLLRELALLAHVRV
jgi:hypothetical protein